MSADTNLRDALIEARERFWSKVDKIAGGCWNWKAGRSSGGYGRFAPSHNKTVYAHRASLLLADISIPDGMVVDHVCRNRGCVNPEHLRVVTPRVNSLENSEAVTASNAVKTHCDQGHELSEYNLYPHSKGYRICLTCARVQWDKQNAKRLERRHARGLLRQPRKQVA